MRITLALRPVTFLEIYEKSGLVYSGENRMI